MALSQDQIVETKVQPQRATLKVVDGAITIFAGALLAYEAGNIGYVNLASDALTEEFAGIALENKTLTAALNTADGTYDVEVIPRGSGEWVKLTVSSTITINGHSSH